MHIQRKLTAFTLVCWRCNIVSDECYQILETTGAFCNNCLKQIEEMDEPNPGIIYTLDIYNTHTGKLESTDSIVLHKPSKREPNHWIVDIENRMGEHKNVVWDLNNLFSKPYKCIGKVLPSVSRLDSIE